MFAIQGAIASDASRSPALSRAVVAALMQLADAPDVSSAQKADFFDSLRHSHGRTALALSGGGALALSHLGVCSVLAARGLLPRVIAGSSGGAIIAGILALSRDDELERVFARSAAWLPGTSLAAFLGLDCGGAAEASARARRRRRRRRRPRRCRPPLAAAG